MIIGLLLFLCTALCICVEWLVQAHKASEVCRRQDVLQEEVFELRRDAARYNAPSTFSKHAIALRKTAAKEKELDALHDVPKDPRQRDWQDQVVLVIKVLKVVLFAGATVACWQLPVAELPPYFTRPFTTTLTSPHRRLFSGSGYIAALPWLLLCARASRAGCMVFADACRLLVICLLGLGPVTGEAGAPEIPDETAAHAEPSAKTGR